LTRGHSRTSRPGGGSRRVAVSAIVEVMREISERIHHEGAKGTKATKATKENNKKNGCSS
jgi:hypothetical protein